MDEHPRSRHAEARGVDDARDLLDVELRRGRKRPAADARAAALHGLRRDPERGPRACLLRRAEPEVLGQLDAAGGWNWTYWERVLEPLVREISAASPLAPALRNPGTTRELPTSDRSVRAISRRGRNGELWVIAVRGVTKGQSTPRSVGSRLLRAPPSTPRTGRCRSQMARWWTPSAAGPFTCTA